MSEIDRVVRGLAAHVRRHPRSLLTLFDDAGGVRFEGAYLLVKADGLAASTAKYPWCTYRDFGFKAVSAAVSDVLAKGCTPLLYAISVGVPRAELWALNEIVGGIEEAVEVYGGYIENADTNVGGDAWVDVFVVAACRYAPIPRGARLGAPLVVSRRVGLSWVAYREYAAGRVPSCREAAHFSCRPAPEPRIVEALERLRGCIIGSIDVSDTFYEALKQLTEPAGLGVYAFTSPSELLHPLALDYARATGVEPLEVVLGASEEYAVVLAVEEGCLDEVLDVMRWVGLDPRIVGVATSPPTFTWRGLEVPGYVWDYVRGVIVKLQEGSERPRGFSAYY